MASETGNLAYPGDLGYVGETHEWARLDGDVCTVGISDYAQHEIGDVVFVELPDVGDAVAADGDFGVIESVKSAFDVFSPISGEVVEVNSELETRPELLNEDPYDGGWMIRIRMGDPAELGRLMNATEYRAAVEGE